MKPITSLFDFFNKVEGDKRYENVAIIAYAESQDIYNRSQRDKSQYDLAKELIERWVRDNSSRIDYDCGRMTRYLNECMEKIPKWQDDTLEPLDVRDLRIRPT